MKAFEIAVLLLALSVSAGTVAGLVTATNSESDRKADAAAWQVKQDAAKHDRMCKTFPTLKVCK